MLLNRVFRRTAWQVQIDLSPIASRVCTPPMSLRLKVYSPWRRTFRSNTRGLSSGLRLRARHLSHDAPTAFAVSRCSQRPEGAGTNLRRRSDAVLDQPLVDKIHSPSAIQRSRLRRLTVTASYSETPTLRRCIPLRYQCRTLQLLAALDIEISRTSTSFSLPKDDNRDQCQAYDL